MIKDQLETWRVGLGRPLAPIPKTDCEVAGMIVLQQQSQDDQRFGRLVASDGNVLCHRGILFRETRLFHHEISATMGGVPERPPVLEGLSPARDI
jgi:hypothetical protein